MRDVKASVSSVVVAFTFAAWALGGSTALAASSWPESQPVDTAPVDTAPEDTTPPVTTEPGDTVPGPTVPDATEPDATTAGERLVGAGEPDGDLDPLYVTLAIVGFIGLLAVASWWMVRRDDPDAGPMPPPRDPDGSAGGLI